MVTTSKVEIANITFNRSKHPGIEFDFLALDELINIKGLDHSPLDHHHVNFYILILVTTGSSKHSIDFKDHPIKKGSIVTIRKDQFHKYHHADVKGFNLLFTEEFVVSYIEKSSANKISELFNELLYNQVTDLDAASYEELFTISSQIKTEFEKPHDDHTSGIIRNLLQVLISKLHRIRKPIVSLENDHKYISQFIEFQNLVEKHCSESRSVSFYADKLNVTPKTINNISQSVIKKPPKTFIDEVLILQIKRQLINSSVTVKEIAYNSGFGEPTNLFKFFKRYTGETPESFRNKFLVS